MLKLSVLTCAMILVATTSEARVPAGSVWSNQRTSVMTIASVDANGQFTGTYVNNDTAHKHCFGTPYPLTGFTDGEQYVFSVIWTSAAEDCHSMTTWFGHIDNNVLKTEYRILYKQNGAFGIEQGTDDFTAK